ncbi:murein L,D-transpeptidase [Phenylobacterium sp.]|uniref:L,D-transpeptidase family protein n=1 Tax=Phenylobacterium sp. TaxID=1871053 RepID=UPI0035B1E218
MKERAATSALGGWALAAALALCAVGHAAQAQAQATAFTPQERAAILPALDDCARGGAARLGQLDDDALQAALIEQARTDLGQRIRPSQVDSFWAIEPPKRDVEAEFAQARAQGRLQAWIQGLEPTFPRYRALQAGCRRYAALVASGGWEPLADGPALRAGDHDPAVAALRLRLAREGYAPATAQDPELFDDALAEALGRFQERHGLEADAVLGPKTRAALNVTAQARLSQIEMNLERWRWLPRTLPAERIEVDIGGAEATYFVQDKPALAMRAVVGDPKHHTPMFISRVESVLFNPPWNVPTSIVQKEILPKAARNPGYLAKNNFTYIDGRLVQRPGPKNSLGVVKFDLPSPFGVYLHDTPAKSAFDRTDRALSHGCMRLQKPRELAALLLGRQGQGADTVEQAIAAGVTSRTMLTTAVPLYVVYWTAVADDAGEVSFRPDVYGWDDKLAAALAEAQAKRAALSQAATGCGGGEG